MIAIVFIPLAVGTAGVWMGSVANWIIEIKSSRFRQQLGQKDLTQDDIDMMDGNGDGHVTMAEFLEFMLVAMNKVDQQLIDELKEHFCRLDCDGTGELTRDDLVEAAKKKLHSPEHKLRLAYYKKHLLSVGRTAIR